METMPREEVREAVLSGDPYLRIDEVISIDDDCMTAIALIGRISVAGETTTELEFVATEAVAPLTE